MIGTQVRRMGASCLVLALLGGTAFAQFRTVDGSNNNPLDPSMGSAGTPLRRATTVDYGDGVASPAGASRPSPRRVSNRLLRQWVAIFNPRGASDFVWQWGQFLDHDIDLTVAAEPAEPFDVPVPLGDPWFDPAGTGTQVIPLNRSAWMLDLAGVRQQRNEITTWIDGSMVYGSDAARMAELRAFDGEGRLATSPGFLLPFNVNGFPNGGGDGDPTLFLAGDVRANEQVGLTAMHTLFVREHNHWAAFFGSFPAIGEEMAFQFARLVVGSEIQAITYREFLPVVLGPNALPPYAGYDRDVDASIENAFSTASYRFGHSMLPNLLRRYDANLGEIPAGHLPLASAFFAPQEIVNEGIEPILRGLAHQRAQAVDVKIVDAVRNFLFGPPGAGGLDLGALNLQRGRDHGLPSYNQLRMDYGLPPRTSFAEISSNANVVAALEDLYATVDDVDAWIGGLAEDTLPSALVGPLIRAVLADQFTRLRDGDRFWYRHALRPAIAAFVEQQTLAVIIKRNTPIGAELQPDVFHVPPGP